MKNTSIAIHEVLGDYYNRFRIIPDKYNVDKGETVHFRVEGYNFQGDVLWNYFIKLMFDGNQIGTSGYTDKNGVFETDITFDDKFTAGLNRIYLDRDTNVFVEIFLKSGNTGQVDYNTDISNRPKINGFVLAGDEAASWWNLQDMLVPGNNIELIPDKTKHLSMISADNDCLQAVNVVKDDEKGYILRFNVDNHAPFKDLWHDTCQHADTISKYVKKYDETQDVQLYFSEKSHCYSIEQMNPNHLGGFKIPVPDGTELENFKITLEADLIEDTAKIGFAIREGDNELRFLWNSSYELEQYYELYYNDNNITSKITGLETFFGRLNRCTFTKEGYDYNIKLDGLDGKAPDVGEFTLPEFNISNAEVYFILDSEHGIDDLINIYYIGLEG